MNSHTPKLLKFAIALLVTLATGAILSGPAAAADRFLNAPVEVQPQPEGTAPSGALDFVEAESGEAVAVWGESAGLTVSVRLPGGDFGEPVLAVPGEAYSANPELAIAPNGYTVMTWRQSVAGISQVMRAVRQPGAANFGPALQVSDEDFQIANIDAQVAVADDGLTILVWKGLEIDGDNNSTRIRKRFLTSTGELNGAITNVSAVSPDGNQFPDVDMGPEGHALVSWMVGEAPDGDLGTCWMEPGGGASDVQILNTDSGTTLEGEVDAEGNAVIAYRDGNALIGDSRPAGPGQNFLVDQILDLAGTGPYQPQIGMDAAGVATVAFAYFGGGQEGIQVVQRPAGAGQFFGTAEKVIPENPDVNDTTLGVGATGNLIIGYTLDDDRVYAIARDAGATAFTAPHGPISPVAETGEVVAGADGQGKGIVTYSTLDVPSDDYTISALPYDDVPVAGQLSIPASAVEGEPVNFSVTPTDPWAEVTGIEWQVDPGVAKTGAQVTHAYSTPGPRTVALKLTDGLGNVTEVSGEITVTAKPPVPPDTTAPKITKLSMLKKKSKRGKKNAFRFTLSEKARVVIKVKRTSKGKGKKAQGRIVKQNVAAGKRRIAFRGKVGKRKLKPARYRATITAIDAAGNRSKPRSIGFRIIR